MLEGIQPVLRGQRGAGLVKKLLASVSSTTTTFVPIHPDLKLVYESSGGLLLIGCEIPTYAINATIGLDLLVNGIRMSQRIGAILANGITSHRSNTVNGYVASSHIQYPLEGFPPGLVEIVPAFARTSVSGTAQVLQDADDPPCVLWVMEFSG